MRETRPKIVFENLTFFPLLFFPLFLALSSGSLNGAATPSPLPESSSAKPFFFLLNVKISSFFLTSEAASSLFNGATAKLAPHYRQKTSPLPMLQNVHFFPWCRYRSFPLLVLPIFFFSGCVLFQSFLPRAAANLLFTNGSTAPFSQSESMSAPLENSPFPPLAAHFSPHFHDHLPLLIFFAIGFQS